MPSETTLSVFVYYRTLWVLLPNSTSTPPCLCSLPPYIIPPKPLTLIMTSQRPHSKDMKQQYVPQSTSQQPYVWTEDAYYSQASGHPSSNQPYYAHPGPMMMEPAHPMLGYPISSAPMGSISPHSSIPRHYDIHSPHERDHAYQYSPSASAHPHTPAFGTPPTPSLHFSPSASGHMSLSSASSRLLNDPSLPEDIRSALFAAMESPEFARGENVPPEILMPTVRKMDKELWECRICGKGHKRRDHTLTHVRTAHLDNKGFRCTYPGCDSAFGRKGDLDRHFASTHQTTEPADSVCPKCHAQLHRKDNLIRHMKTCKVSASGSTSRSSRRTDLYSSTPYPTVRCNSRTGHGLILALSRCIEPTG